MPWRNAQVLLVLVMWLHVGGIRAFTVQPLSLMPSFTAREVTQSALRGMAKVRKKVTPCKAGSKAQPFDSQLTSATKNSLQQFATSAVAAVFAGDDDLTIHQLGTMLRNAHEINRNTMMLPRETIQRNLLAERRDDLNLNRCSVAPSTISCAGQGLFASRDIAVGELITCYPGDVVLCWEDAGKQNAQMYHGKHIDDTEANMLRFTNDLHSYEVGASATLGVLGDPLLCGDPSYLGHLANDGARPQADFSVFLGARGSGNHHDDAPRMVNAEQEAEDKARYDASSAARVNAEHVALEGSHMITRALLPIPAGREVFVTYGYGYWRSEACLGHRLGAARALKV